jgi:hypothetical protein
VFSTCVRKEDSHIANPKQENKVNDLTKNGILERKHKARSTINVTSNPLLPLQGEMN